MRRVGHAQPWLLLNLRLNIRGIMKMFFEQIEAIAEADMWAGGALLR